MLKKILLTCSLIALGIGFSDVGEASQWGLGRPLGAVFFILYFIVMLLEKESALYDAEQRRNTEKPRQSSPVKPLASGVWQPS
ncbi:hypothetical protein [Pedosphaera parvula]|uniref:Uncharacterized protein n=1 Tax=Pedosphaera parvula (strain Ellin514) TaxID=320771 RepID=B9XBI1_PEDPL|nr:hypothetical protein [Pedosphaera parvula]EEF62866.1 hypothetical protein Cflav_PD5501 [Pedosphaera parvula Ellin514]